MIKWEPSRYVSYPNRSSAHAEILCKGFLDPYGSRQDDDELLVCLQEGFCPVNQAEELVVEGSATAYWRGKGTKRRVRGLGSGKTLFGAMTFVGC